MPHPLVKEQFAAPSFLSLSTFRPSNAVEDSELMKALDSTGISIEEFADLFRQCSACTNIMVVSNVGRHLCKGSNLSASPFSSCHVHSDFVGLNHLESRRLTHLGKLPPENASALDIYRQAHSKEGISAPKVGDIETQRAQPLGAQPHSHGQICFRVVEKNNNLCLPGSLRL